MYKAYIYLIIKEYKAGKQKRAFKVSPCKYIKYLVKYIAFNIYKI
jgi:hypothetical protein